jgi:hypothetical protein
MESALQVRTVIHVGQFPDVWHERRSRMNMDEQEECEFVRSCTLQPGITENWLGLARVAASCLTWSAITVAGISAVVWAGWLLRQWLIKP